MKSQIDKIELQQALNQGEFPIDIPANFEVMFSEGETPVKGKNNQRCHYNSLYEAKKNSKVELWAGFIVGKGRVRYPEKHGDAHAELHVWNVKDGQIIDLTFDRKVSNSQVYCGCRVDSLKTSADKLYDNTLKALLEARSTELKDFEIEVLSRLT